MYRRSTLLIIATGCNVLGCAQEAHPVEQGSATAGLTPGEGYIEVTGGKVWYEVVGSGTATPLLLLHGGPGATSHYLGPLKRLADERPVIFYDQLGCGRSDRPEDSSLWQIDRFVEELAQVREALSLEKVHILGHSWGSMLVVEYLLTRQPTGVESLILAGPALSMPRWLEDTTKLVESLPPEIQATLKRHERAGTTDSAEYQEAEMEFNRRHLCRLDPWPPEMEQGFEEFGTAVFETMWGPSEFHATGNLKDFDRTERLSEINIPTLLTAGRYDEATPETSAWYQSFISGSRLEIFENSSHMTMLEEPDHYVQVVREFLHTVDKGTAD